MVPDAPDMVLAEAAADLNFNTLIALSGLVAAVIAILMKISDKSISRHEHTEFKAGVERRFTDVEGLMNRKFSGILAQMHRDLDRVEEDLRIIDSTKPSAGELQEAMKAVGARVANLEESVRHFRPIIEPRKSP